MLIMARLATARMPPPVTCNDLDDHHPMDPAQIQALIESHLPGCSAQVTSPDNVHYEALIVGEAFAGKRPLQRHQMVYAALGGRIGGDIHALSITALTPEEQSRRAGR